MNLQGGFKAISYNGIPVVTDRFVEDGTMYMLNTKDSEQLSKKVNNIDKDDIDLSSLGFKPIAQNGKFLNIYQLFYTNILIFMI